MRTYRFQNKKKNFTQINYEKEFMIDENKKITDMNKYYIEKINKKDSIHKLSEAMKLLDKEQYFIIHSLFFEGKTEATITKELNISQQALNWKKKKILLFFKNYLLNS